MCYVIIYYNLLKRVYIEKLLCICVAKCLRLLFHNICAKESEMVFLCPRINVSLKRSV